MNRLMTRGGLAVLALAVAVWLGAGRPVAAQSSRIDGVILDIEGKPWVEVSVTLTSDQGQKFTVVTDAKGRFTQAGLRSGVYELSFKAPTQEIGYTMSVRLATGQEERITVNFKELRDKALKENAELMKKQEEEASKFGAMKAHFDQGRAALEQARQIRADLTKAPPDQRAAMTQQATQLGETAINELAAAEKAAGEKEANLHTIVANLGLAYETAGRYEEAAAAYQRAINLKPTETGYYVGLGNALAKQGKAEEAGASCDKVAALAPANAATCWRNLGIVLYNANNLKAAVEPLRKATTLDPSNPDSWYLLGASLLASMETKQVGDKLTFVIQPGTVEAYVKYLEIAPNGRFAADAQAALASLESLGAGVPTKMKVSKKRP